MLSILFIINCRGYKVIYSYSVVLVKLFLLILFISVRYINLFSFETLFFSQFVNCGIVFNNISWNIIVDNISRFFIRFLMKSQHYQNHIDLSHWLDNHNIYIIFCNYLVYFCNIYLSLNSWYFLIFIFFSFLNFNSHVKIKRIFFFIIIIRNNTTSLIIFLL